MKVQIYANYGVLAHEKQIIFTAGVPHCHSVCSDKIAVDIPDDYQPYVTASETVAMHLPDSPWLYKINDVLVSINNRPALAWYDGHKDRYVMLRVVEGEEALT